MPDLIELTGWSESKVRRARQELYDKRLLHFGKWKERRGPAVGSIYRLLEPGEEEPREAQPSVTDHPVTGDTPPCHQQQPPYEEGYEDLRDLDVRQSAQPRAEGPEPAPVEARTDRRSASPATTQEPPKDHRWHDVLEVLWATDRWVRNLAKDTTMLDELEAVEPTRWVSLLGMARRFQRELPDHPGWGRGRGGVRESFRRHVVDCPEEQQAWLLAPVDDLEHCEAGWMGDDCPACEELADLVEPWGVAMRPTLRDWTLDKGVRDRWKAAQRVAGHAAEVPPDSAPSADAPALFETGPGFAEYVRVKREVLG